MTDPLRNADPLADLARLNRTQGVLIRHYDDPNRAPLTLAIARITKARRLTLLVASDWRLAATVHAHGVHLPEGQLRSGRLAPLLGWVRRKGAIVTAACHSRQALATAQRFKINAALVSPVFATQSHPRARPLGLLGLARIKKNARIPIFALGGMTHKRFQSAKRRGASGWASVRIPLSA